MKRPELRPIVTDPDASSELRALFESAALDARPSDERLCRSREAVLTSVGAGGIGLTIAGKALSAKVLGAKVSTLACMVLTATAVGVTVHEVAMQTPRAAMTTEEVVTTRSVAATPPTHRMRRGRPLPAASPAEVPTSAGVPDVAAPPSLVVAPAAGLAGDGERFAPAVEDAPVKNAPPRAVASARAPLAAATAATRPLAPATPSPQPAAWRDEPSAPSDAWLLLAARAALRQREPERALALLDERPFDHSAFSEEHDALEIEALAELGRVEHARRQFGRFARMHPTSTYRTRLEPLVGEIAPMTR